MKKLFLFTLIAAMFAGCEETVVDQQEELMLQKSKASCTTIQSGLLVNSLGDPITTGYTEFGYNYQAHIYNGDYGYPEWNLVMKWNDAWLSNKDCDGDGLLDRHYGYDSYIGSGAWETNHWTTTYINSECHFGTSRCEKQINDLY